MNTCSFRILALCCAFFIFLSCENSENHHSNTSPTKAGVVITFDDTFVDDWYLADQTLQNYSWKATFCVSKINTLNNAEIAKLIELQNEGHEIAGHGLNHLNATDFISNQGTNEYMNQEINPMLAIMHNVPLHVNTFAYPYGSRSTTSDAALLNKFQILRGTTYSSTNPSQQNCYFNGSNIVFGLGIDSNYTHFSIPYILDLLAYAKQNHKILILYGHKPVNNVTADYETKMETLNIICNYIKQNNMKFYTLSELNNL